MSTCILPDPILLVENSELIFPDFLSSLSAFQTIGALPDFADKLVDYAYDRQAIWDPANGPRYLQALKDIASSRSSESLQTKVVLLESQGQMTQGALDEACGYFKIEQSHIKELNDEHVLGRFNVLYEDCGPAEKTKAREMLNRIGIAKSSARLQAVASQSTLHPTHSLNATHMQQTLFIAFKISCFCSTSNSAIWVILMSNVLTSI